jgi:hypothetical protein
MGNNSRGVVDFPQLLSHNCNNLHRDRELLNSQEAWKALLPVILKDQPAELMAIRVVVTLLSIKSPIDPTYPGGGTLHSIQQTVRHMRGLMYNTAQENECSRVCLSAGKAGVFLAVGSWT